MSANFFSFRLLSCFVHDIHISDAWMLQQIYRHRFNKYKLTRLFFIVSFSDWTGFLHERRFFLWLLPLSIYFSQYRVDSLWNVWRRGVETKKERKQEISACRTLMTQSTTTYNIRCVHTAVLNVKLNRKFITYFSVDGRLRCFSQRHFRWWLFPPLTGKREKIDDEIDWLHSANMPILPSFW